MPNDVICFFRFHKLSIPVCRGHWIVSTCFRVEMAAALLRIHYTCLTHVLAPQRSFADHMLRPTGNSERQDLLTCILLLIKQCV